MILAQVSSQGPSIGDLIWIIILLSAFQPALQRYFLTMRRLRMLQRIERQRGTRVIALIHRQETMGLLGFPILRYLDVEDSEEVLRAIRLTPPEMPIDVILHTPGGLVLAADQIAEALCHHPGRVSAMVPHYAMSGGTLVAMAADEILMAPSAVLGPVDPQLGQYPAASILAAVGRKPVAEVNDRTLILADIASKAMRQIDEAVQQILEANGMAAEQAKVIAEQLSTGKWTHDYPLGLGTLKSLGLPVSDGVPNTVFDLMALYPQPMRGQPSVQYIPVPYERQIRRSERASGEGH
ncbi:MAG: SDH family Clp fold serine proteinase [Ktedonobacterales bacterium]